MFNLFKNNRCNTGTHKSGSRCIKNVPKIRNPQKTYKKATSLECKIDGTKKYCGNDKPLRPIIARAGGKSQLADKIISKMKEHRLYNEPFVGGGAVFLKKPLAQKNYINDKDKDVIKVYKKFKSGNGFNSCDMMPSRKRFDSIKHKSNKSACDVAYLNKLSFGAGGTNFGGEKKYHHKSKDVGITYQKAHQEDYKEKLKNTTITSEDFRKSMNRVKNVKDSVTFADPPYVESDKMYKERGVTPKEVCDTAKQMKGQVIITYNDHKDVRKACSKGFKVSRISSRYTLGATSNNTKSKELLIIKP
jgi:DNA adenine methylase